MKKWLFFNFFGQGLLILVYVLILSVSDLGFEFDKADLGYEFGKARKLKRDNIKLVERTPTTKKQHKEDRAPSVSFGQ